MPCSGTADDHCCYLKGQRCPFSEDNTLPDRRWVCGLRRKLGNWDDVLASDEYMTVVAPVFEPLGINCRDWPDGEGANSAVCGECGVHS